MQNFGLIDYQEYRKKIEKNQANVINPKKSISFENFLKSKSFKLGELASTPNKILRTPGNRNDIEKSFEKTPPKKRDNLEQLLKFDYLSSSLKRMRQLIDSNFKKTQDVEIFDERLSTKNGIPTSYLEPETNEEFVEKNLKNSNSPPETPEKYNEDQRLDIKEKNIEISNESEFLSKEINEKSKYSEIKDEIKFSNTFFISGGRFNEEISNNANHKYTSLKDRKEEFQDFLDHFGWKSRTYLKNNEDKEGGSKEIKLKFQNKQNYIKTLNSKICDFKETEGILQQNIDNFHQEKTKNQPNSEKNTHSMNELKWKEKFNTIKNPEQLIKEKKQFIEFDLGDLLRNTKINKKKIC